MQTRLAKSQVSSLRLGAVTCSDVYSAVRRKVEKEVAAEDG